MKVTAKTDIGCCRNENQDNYRAVFLGDECIWAAVFDGMGGSNGGSIASRLAAETMQEAVENSEALFQNSDKPVWVEQAILKAHARILETSRRNPALEGMGTTAVTAFIQKNTAHIFHVGDSRAYLFRNGALTQLTRDHSVVQELVDAGKITPEEAEHNPQKNLITRALGVRSAMEAEYTNSSVVAGDVLLLCTDGLTNMVSKRIIEETLCNTSFYQVPDKLIQKALEGGGQDNVTVLLLGIEPTEA